jgi:hypothetical protein
MAATNAPVLERRGHLRFAARELNGLRGARVKYGQAIDVIDLSAGGVLFETAALLTHEATIVLEFSSSTKTVLIPSRVVRCRNLRRADYSVTSQGACAFKRPLALKDLVIGTPEAPTALSQPVIMKCRDGRIVSGYTSDFSTAKSHVHLSPSRSTAATDRFALSELDAIFFLRDGADTNDADGRTAPHGRKVALVLPSGEELTGSTLNYRRDSSGVFVYPFERDFGVDRIFVTPHGIHQLRLL